MLCRHSILKFYQFGIIYTNIVSKRKILELTQHIRETNYNKH